ncbi:MAG: 4Fe-4S binding protein, partial [Flectobacillus sp.]|uniref:4Fe-4S binding protein n=1 Tax=Flectobacillus sp. TaxID=50419 RepID=UPI003B98FA60
MQKGANSTYWGNIKEGIKTSLKGLSLSFKHFKDARQSRKPIFVDDPQYFDQKTGIVTTQYPYEQLPVPDNGRYQLHNEMDDCIVCDKCAKICPVDCIEIEPIKATGVVSYASDGSAIRLYAAKFDIDMSKCCFCGLCTTVCPTECLTMKKEYDFSVFDITEHNFAFGNLTEEQADEKKKLYEQYMLEKEAFKKETAAQKAEPKVAPKPAFKPAARPVAKTETPDESSADATAEAPKPATRPAFKPKMKVESDESKPTTDETSTEDTPKPAARPAFKPKMKVAPSIESPVENTAEGTDENATTAADEVKPARPAFRPKFKPATK